MEDLRDLRADFLSVAYNPGKAVRGTSVAVAAWLKHQAGRDVTFTLATRDMNRLALQSLLLGAQLLDLENVVVVQGDRFTAKEREHVQPVPDIIPTELLDTIAELNAGQDYRGRDLAAPAAFCAGATMDLGRDGARELALTRLKVEAGAQFFLLQALFQPERLQDFLERYAGAYGESLTAPVFCGVQVLTPESLVLRRRAGLDDWGPEAGAARRGDRPTARRGFRPRRLPHDLSDPADPAWGTPRLSRRAGRDRPFTRSRTALAAREPRRDARCQIRARSRRYSASLQY